MKTIRFTLLIVVLVFALWMISAHLNVFSLHDFIEYWSSGRLNVAGENPYNPDKLLKIEQSVGWNKKDALMMWNPPWTLTIVMVFSVFPYLISRFFWFLTQIALLLLCAISLWKIYGGEKRYEWLALVTLFTFGPILHILKIGQITVLVLLGSVGFLFFINKGYDFWAGALASLMLVKPHLLYLFVLAVVIWSISGRRFRVFFGLITGLIILTGVAWLFNPNLILQYLSAIKSYPPENWMTATIGVALRMLFGTDKFYLQFIPSIIGGVWLIIYWLKNQKKWDWVEVLPMITLVSITTSSYGWAFDVAICIWAVIQITAIFDFKEWTFPKILIFTSYWGVNLLIILISKSQSWFWWLSTYFLLWYLLSYHYLSKHRDTLQRKEPLLIT